MTAELPPAALDLVRNFEGLYLKAYLCPAGVPTISYGHTAGVKMGQTITSLQAEVYLRADMSAAAAAVDKLVTVPLTDRQRGPLASFVFNLGAGALRDSTLLRLLNQRDYKGAAGQFGRWVYATVNGVKTQLPGAGEALGRRGEAVREGLILGRLSRWGWQVSRPVARQAIVLSGTARDRKLSLTRVR